MENQFNRRQVLSTVGASIVASLGVSGQAAASGSNTKSRTYSTKLTGDKQVPSVETDATAHAIFYRDEDKTEIGYAILVDFICNVTQAHIHLGNEGENGPVVAWLYPNETEEPKLIEGRFEGCLSVGTLSEDDLVGPWEDASLEEAVEALGTEGAYVNIHTKQHPDGEIRGQIAPIEEAPEGDKETEEPPADDGPKQPPTDDRPEEPPEAGGPEEPPTDDGPEEPPADDGPKQPPADDGPEEPPEAGGPKEPPEAGGPEEPPADDGPEQPPAGDGPEEPPEGEGNTVTINVVDLESSNAVDIPVSLTGENYSATNTASEGTVTFENVPNGEYNVQPAADNWWKQPGDEAALVVEGDTTYTLEVRGELDTYTLRVTVLDAEIGVPIEGATVSGVGDTYPSGADILIQGDTDRNGIATIEAPESGYILDVSADGYQTSTPIEVDVDSNTYLTIGLEPEEGLSRKTTLTVSVVDDETGEPLEGEISANFPGWGYGFPKEVENGEVTWTTSEDGIPILNEYGGDTAEVFFSENIDGYVIEEGTTNDALVVNLQEENSHTLNLVAEST